jgi:hypothetical protein
MDPIKETFGFLPTKVAKNAMVSKKRNSCVRWRDPWPSWNHQHAAGFSGRQYGTAGAV